MLDQIEGLAKQEPVLVLYEDAHWADPTSLDLIDMLVDRLAGLSVLLIITGRPEFAPAWTDRHNASTIALTRLDRLHAGAMVASVAGGVALPLDVLDKIVAKTDGVPLFVEELTRTVLESGLLSDAGQNRPIAGPLPSLAIPATLQDSLMARLDRAGAVKEIAQIGATIGHEFPYKLLLAVAGMSEAGVRDALGKLVGSELASCHGVPPDAVYTFKHALVQDAAYESLLKTRCRVFHRRIAKALRDRFPFLAERQPEIVAHHLTLAGKSQQAVDWWTRAGALVAGRGAFVEAVNHYRRAIELADALPSDAPAQQSRLQLQIALREALIHVRGWASPETVAAFAQAAEIAVQTADPEEKIVSACHEWLVAFIQGHAYRSLHLVESRIAEAQRSECAHQDLYFSGLLAQSRWICGHFSAAVPAFEKDLAVYDLGKLPKFLSFSAVDSKVASLCFFARTLWALGRVDEGRATIEEANAHARQLGEMASIIFARGLTCIFNAKCGNLARLRSSAEELIASSRDNNLTIWLHAGNMCLNLACRDPDRRQDAIAKVRHEMSVSEELRATIHEPLFEGLRADLEGLEDPHLGLSILDGILAKTALSGNCRFDAELHRRRGLLLRRLSPSETAPAEAALGQSLTVARDQKARTFELRATLDLARLYCDTGRERAAIAPLAGALVGFTETAELPEIGEARQLLTSLGGVVPPAAGEPS